jgi:hypothetical protein
VAIVNANLTSKSAEVKVLLIAWGVFQLEKSALTIYLAYLECVKTAQMKVVGLIVVLSLLSLDNTVLQTITVNQEFAILVIVCAQVRRVNAMEEVLTAVLGV